MVKPAPAATPVLADDPQPSGRLGSSLKWYINLMIAERGMTKVSGDGLPKAKRRGRYSISSIAISGYKSVNCEQTIRIAPLTLLAGANSSGKSSMMQPLLLLKQTLEATYDPGPLLINGPNVKFTTTEQMFSQCGKQLPHDERLAIAIGLHGDEMLTTLYKRSRQKLEIEKMTYSDGQFRQTFHMAMSDAEIRRTLPSHEHELFRSMADAVKPAKLHWRVARNRCFLELALLSDEHEQMIYRASPSQSVAYHIRDIIHLPGLRGNPERTYPVTAVGRFFPGSFDKYAASVIAKWQADKQLKELRKVGSYLELLGLTWKVATDAVDETQVQLKVGRLPHAARGGANDLASFCWRILVVTLHDRRRFVEKLDFLTTPGYLTGAGAKQHAEFLAILRQSLKKPRSWHGTRRYKTRDLVVPSVLFCVRCTAYSY